MDSYHAPYKAKHRYWPGLLLVLRFVVLLVFAFSTQEELSINLLAILVGTGILVVWAWVSGGVYRNWCLRWPGRLFCSEHDHLSCCHLPCQTFGLKSACSWVHFCLHSIYNVHCNSCDSAGKCDWHHSIP